MCRFVREQVTFSQLCFSRVSDCTAVAAPPASLQADIRSDKLPTAARPETYQNLIYSFKDQQHPTRPNS
jgi:hypothetical protein